MFQRQPRLLALAGLLLSCAMLAPATASANKPIEIIVTFPPGGGTDLLARLVGNYFNE